MVKVKRPVPAGCCSDISFTIEAGIMSTFTNKTLHMRSRGIEYSWITKISVCKHICQQYPNNAQLLDELMSNSYFQDIVCLYLTLIPWRSMLYYIIVTIYYDYISNT